MRTPKPKMLPRKPLRMRQLSSFGCTVGIDGSAIGFAWLLLMPPPNGVWIGLPVV
jgi:hypothetical protein